MNSNESNNPTTYPPPNPYPPYPYPPYEEDEIDLLEIWNTLWRGKWFIILFTGLCTLISIWYALNQTPIFKAEVILAPVSGSNQSGVGTLAAQLGGVASMIGMNIGTTSQSLNTTIAIIESREFAKSFIKKYGLLPNFYETLWDKQSGKWSEINMENKPTLLDGANSFNSIRNVNVESNGLVKISITWKNPETAAKLANDFVKHINDNLRKKAIIEAKKSIQYLEHEIAKTSNISMQEVLYRLIEKQTQAITMAQVKEQYAFSIIDPAIVPESRYKPNRRLIVILGTIAGCLISVFSQFLYIFIKKVKNNNNSGKQNLSN